ncbi:peptidoglycan-recognition protein SC2-like [Tubulanus polymorphus]|uniref:peptidoglycan-recognition protein SC2-like n=1 Tax=Tubulanus polymorphus TaxID=672921 RepID=UPI003DA602C5
MSNEVKMRVKTSLLIIFTVIRVSEECNCPTVISRSAWGARSPKAVTKIRYTPRFAFIHHSDGSSCTSVYRCKRVVKGIQNYHINSKGWSDIGYNFLIGGDGNVYEGRGWGVVGAHVRGYNSRSIGICFLGNFMSTSPTSRAIDAAKALLECAVEKGKLKENYRLYGHRDAGSTSCPGDTLYKLIKQWPHY